MAILATLACTISDTGISRPSYSDIYETLQAKFQAIYGSDAYIDPDSQDGQMLAVLARGFDDCNDVAVSVYNSFSPATSQGRALSNNVKLNGIARGIATKSTVPIRVVGQVGTTIASGVASDASGNRWLLPSPIVIPSAGQLDVTATAEADGAITAATGTIVSIQTPTLGWQSVTNTGPAVAGTPVETDATLRKRQTVSTALPSRTVLDGLKGALKALVGVTQAEVYENDSNVTDANGIAAKNIAVVTVGGINTDIANAIMLKKTPGCGTWGSNAVDMTTPGGLPMTIRYYPATVKRVICSVAIIALGGYLSTTGDALKAAVAAYVSGLGIGQHVRTSRLFVPAQLYGGPGSETYELLNVTIAFYGGTPSSADLFLAFNEIASLVVGDVSLSVS